MESRVCLACNKQLEVSCAYPLWNEPPNPHSPSIQKEPKKHMHIVDAVCVSQELSSSIHSSLSAPSLEATHCSGAGLHKLLGSHSLAHCSGAGLLKLLASQSLWHYCSRKQSLEFWNLWIIERPQWFAWTNSLSFFPPCFICLFPWWMPMVLQSSMQGCCKTQASTYLIVYSKHS